QVHLHVGQGGQGKDHQGQGQGQEGRLHHRHQDLEGNRQGQVGRKWLSVTLGGFPSRTSQFVKNRERAGTFPVCHRLAPCGPPGQSDPPNQEDFSREDQALSVHCGSSSRGARVCRLLVG